MKFAKRNTVLIDPQGKIAKVYLAAEAGRNSEQVIADLKRCRQGDNFGVNRKRALLRQTDNLIQALTDLRKQGVR